MKNAENCGSAPSVASIADFVIDVIRHSSMAVLVTLRNCAPMRQPSPKNCPSPKIPTTASLPCSDKTVILTLPFRMKKTLSATSPWPNIFWFFPYRSMVFPASIRPRNALGSNTSFSRTSGELGMVLFRNRAGAQHSRSPARPQAGAAMHHYNPVMCAVDDINRHGMTTQLVVSSCKDVASRGNAQLQPLHRCALDHDPIRLNPIHDPISLFEHVV